MADNEMDNSSSRRAKPAGVKAIADTARSTALRAVDTAGATFDNRPLAAIGGALALGAVVAAMLPPTKQEEAIVGPLGERVRESLGEALQAAREAGAGELTAAGLTFAAATNGLGGVVGSLAKAALTASGAAATSVRKPRRAASDVIVESTEPRETANEVGAETATRAAV